MEKINFNKTNSVAFSGHRSVPEHRKEEMKKKLRGKIRLLYAMGIRNYFCGMALGFDMLAAEVVLSLKSELPQLKLIAVVPFKGSPQGGVITNRQDTKPYSPDVMMSFC